MGSRHERTLREVFERPARSNIEWSRIEAMFVHYGAYVQERAGSRVAVELGERKAVFHRPHPAKEASRSLVRDVRDFCEEAGLTPPDEESE